MPSLVGFFLPLTLALLDCILPLQIESQRGTQTDGIHPRCNYSPAPPRRPQTLSALPYSLLQLRGGKGEGTRKKTPTVHAHKEVQERGSWGLRGWPVQPENVDNMLNSFKEPLVKTGAARRVRRARATDLLLHEDATSIAQLPFKLWRKRVSFSVNLTIEEVRRGGESSMAQAFSMLVAAASAMLSHPRVCTAWALSRFPRSFLGGSVALALESLHTQLLFRTRASSEHVAAAAEGSRGSGVEMRGRGEREGSAQEKDWTKKLQLMLPGSLGFSVRGERGKEDLISQKPAGWGGAGGDVTGGQRTSTVAIGWGGDSELSSTSEVGGGGASYPRKKPQ